MFYSLIARKLLIAFLHIIYWLALFFKPDRTERNAFESRLLCCCWKTMCRTKTISLYKLTNALLLFICFRFKSWFKLGGNKMQNFAGNRKKTKKLRLNMFKRSKFSLFFKNITVNPKKIQKTAKNLHFLE